MTFWGWWLLAGVLGVAEVALPVQIFLWPALAALLMGGLILLGWAMSLEMQILVFGVLSLASLALWQGFYRRRQRPNQLNQGSGRFVGRLAVLEEPIVDGRGRIRLGDGFWLVRGPELAAGTRVRVVASDGAVLTVEAA